MNCARASGRIMPRAVTLELAFEASPTRLAFLQRAFAQHRVEQALIAQQMPVADVVLADVGVRGTSHPVCLRWIVEQLAYRGSEGAKVAWVGQQDARTGGNLVDDPADRRADHRAAL